jgi:Lamin Tail Domain
VLDRLEQDNMPDGAGQQIQLTLWPEDFIISPDPPPPDAATGPRLVAAGDVLIVAALPDPVGADPENELVTLLNTTASPIDLTGWGLVDAAGGRQDLSRTMTAGAVVQVPAEGALQLGNRGEAVVLVDPGGGFIDQVTYTPTGSDQDVWFDGEATVGDARARPPRSPKLCGLVQAGHPARFMIEGDHRQTAGGHQLLCRLALLLGRGLHAVDLDAVLRCLPCEPGRLTLADRERQEDGTREAGMHQCRRAGLGTGAR